MDINTLTQNVQTDPVPDKNPYIMHTNDNPHSTVLRSIALK